MKKEQLFNVLWNSGLILIAVGLLTMDRSIWAGLFASIFGIVFLLKAEELLEG